MKKTTGYSINFAENSITLTKAFAQRAKNPAASEFRELAKLHKNFPELTITMRTAVITADKETHGGLTITRMEFLIQECSFEARHEAVGLTTVFYRPKDTNYPFRTITKS